MNSQRAGGAIVEETLNTAGKVTAVFKRPQNDVPVGDERHLAIHGNGRCCSVTHQKIASPYFAEDKLRAQWYGTLSKQRDLSSTAEQNKTEDKLRELFKDAVRNMEQNPLHRHKLLEWVQGAGDGLSIEVAFAVVNEALKSAFEIAEMRYVISDGDDVFAVTETDATQTKIEVGEYVVATKVKLEKGQISSVLCNKGWISDMNALGLVVTEDALNSAEGNPIALTILRNITLGSKPVKFADIVALVKEQKSVQTALAPLPGLRECLRHSPQLYNQADGDEFVQSCLRHGRLTDKIELINLNHVCARDEALLKALATYNIVAIEKTSLKMQSTDAGNARWRDVKARMYAHQGYTRRAETQKQKSPQSSSLNGSQDRLFSFVQVSTDEADDCAMRTGAVDVIRSDSFAHSVTATADYKALHDSVCSERTALEIQTLQDDEFYVVNEHCPTATQEQEKLERSESALANINEMAQSGHSRAPHATYARFMTSHGPTGNRKNAPLSHILYGKNTLADAARFVFLDDAPGVAVSGDFYQSALDTHSTQITADTFFNMMQQQHGKGPPTGNAIYAASPLGAHRHGSAAAPPETFAPLATKYYTVREDVSGKQTKETVVTEGTEEEEEAAAAAAGPTGNIDIYDSDELSDSDDEEPELTEESGDVTVRVSKIYGGIESQFTSNFETSRVLKDLKRDRGSVRYHFTGQDVGVGNAIMYGCSHALEHQHLSQLFSDATTVMDDCTAKDFDCWAMAARSTDTIVVQILDRINASVQMFPVTPLAQPFETRTYTAGFIGGEGIVSATKRSAEQSSKEAYMAYSQQAHSFDCRYSITDPFHSGRFTYSGVQHCLNKTIASYSPELSNLRGGLHGRPTSLASVLQRRMPWWAASVAEDYEGDKKQFFNRKAYVPRPEVENVLLWGRGYDDEPSKPSMWVRSCDSFIGRQHALHAPVVALEECANEDAWIQAVQHHRAYTKPSQTEATTVLALLEDSDGSEWVTVSFDEDSRMSPTIPLPHRKRIATAKLFEYVKAQTGRLLFYREQTSVDGEAQVYGKYKYAKVEAIDNASEKVTLRVDSGKEVTLSYNELDEHTKPLWRLPTNSPLRAAARSFACMWAQQTTSASTYALYRKAAEMIYNPGRSSLFAADEAPKHDTEALQTVLQVIPVLPRAETPFITPRAYACAGVRSVSSPDKRLWEIQPESTQIETLKESMEILLSQSRNDETGADADAGPAEQTQENPDEGFVCCSYDRPDGSAFAVAKEEKPYPTLQYAGKQTKVYVDRSLVKSRQSQPANHARRNSMDTYCLGSMMQWLQRDVGLPQSLAATVEQQVANGCVHPTTHLGMLGLRAIHNFVDGGNARASIEQSIQNIELLLANLQYRFTAKCNDCALVVARGDSKIQPTDTGNGCEYEIDLLASVLEPTAAKQAEFFATLLTREDAASVLCPHGDDLQTRYTNVNQMDPKMRTKRRNHFVDYVHDPEHKAVTFVRTHKSTTSQTKHTKLFENATGELAFWTEQKVARLNHAAMRTVPIDKRKTIDLDNGTDAATSRYWQTHYDCVKRSHCYQNKLDPSLFAQLYESFVCMATSCAATVKSSTEVYLLAGLFLRVLLLWPKDKSILSPQDHWLLGELMCTSGLENPIKPHSMLVQDVVDEGLGVALQHQSLQETFTEHYAELKKYTGFVENGDVVGKAEILQGVRSLATFTEEKHISTGPLGLERLFTESRHGRFVWTIMQNTKFGEQWRATTQTAPFLCKLYRDAHVEMFSPSTEHTSHKKGLRFEPPEDEHMNQQDGTLLPQSSPSRSRGSSATAVGRQIVNKWLELKLYGRVREDTSRTTSASVRSALAEQSTSDVSFAYYSLRERLEPHRGAMYNRPHPCQPNVRIAPRVARQNARLAVLQQLWFCTDSSFANSAQSKKLAKRQQQEAVQNATRDASLLVGVPRNVALPPPTYDGNLNEVRYKEALQVRTAAEVFTNELSHKFIDKTRGELIDQAEHLRWTSFGVYDGFLPGCTKAMTLGAWSSALGHGFHEQLISPRITELVSDDSIYATQQCTHKLLEMQTLIDESEREVTPFGTLEQTASAIARHFEQMRLLATLGSVEPSQPDAESAPKWPETRHWYTVKQPDTHVDTAQFASATQCRHWVSCQEGDAVLGGVAFTTLLLPGTAASRPAAEKLARPSARNDFSEEHERDTAMHTQVYENMAATMKAKPSQQYCVSLCGSVSQLGKSVWAERGNANANALRFGREAREFAVDAFVHTLVSHVEAMQTSQQSLRCACVMLNVDVHLRATADVRSGFRIKPCLRDFRAASDAEDYSDLSLPSQETLFYKDKQKKCVATYATPTHKLAYSTMDLVGNTEGFNPCPLGGLESYSDNARGFARQAAQHLQYGCAHQSPSTGYATTLRERVQSALTRQLLAAKQYFQHANDVNAVQFKRDIGGSRKAIAEQNLHWLNDASKTVKVPTVPLVELFVGRGASMPELLLSGTGATIDFVRHTTIWVCDAQLLDLLDEAKLSRSNGAAAPIANCDMQHLLDAVRHLALKFDRRDLRKAHVQSYRREIAKCALLPDACLRVDQLCVYTHRLVPSQDSLQKLCGTWNVGNVPVFRYYSLDSDKTSKRYAAINSPVLTPRHCTNSETHTAMLDAVRQTINNTRVCTTTQNAANPSIANRLYEAAHGFTTVHDTLQDQQCLTVAARIVVHVWPGMPNNSNYRKLDDVAYYAAECFLQSAGEILAPTENENTIYSCTQQTQLCNCGSQLLEIHYDNRQTPLYFWVDPETPFSVVAQLVCTHLKFPKNQHEKLKTSQFEFEGIDTETVGDTKMIRLKTREKFELEPRLVYNYGQKIAVELIGTIKADCSNGQHTRTECASWESNGYPQELVTNFTTQMQQKMNKENEAIAVAYNLGIVKTAELTHLCVSFVNDKDNRTLARGLFEELKQTIVKESLVRDTDTTEKPSWKYPDDLQTGYLYDCAYGVNAQPGRDLHFNENAKKQLCANGLRGPTHSYVAGKISKTLRSDTRGVPTYTATSEGSPKQTTSDFGSGLTSSRYVHESFMTQMFGPFDQRETARACLSAADQHKLMSPFLLVHKYASCYCFMLKGNKTRGFLTHSPLVQLMHNMTVIFAQDEIVSVLEPKSKDQNKKEKKEKEKLTMSRIVEQHEKYRNVMGETHSIASELATMASLPDMQKAIIDAIELATAWDKAHNAAAELFRDALPPKRDKSRQDEASSDSDSDDIDAAHPRTNTGKVDGKPLLDEIYKTITDDQSHRQPFDKICEVVELLMSFTAEELFTPREGLDGNTLGEAGLYLLRSDYVQQLQAESPEIEFPIKVFTTRAVSPLAKAFKQQKDAQPQGLQWLRRMQELSEWLRKLRNYFDLCNTKTDIFGKTKALCAACVAASQSVRTRLLLPQKDAGENFDSRALKAEPVTEQEKNHLVYYCTGQENSNTSQMTDAKQADIAIASALAATAAACNADTKKPYGETVKAFIDKTLR